MRCAVNFYGNAESVLALDFCLRQGHSVECLMTVGSNDMSSMFYQAQSTDLLEVMSEALEKPLVAHYFETGQEVFELEQFLAQIKNSYQIEGVAFGNVQNRLQHIQVQNVCAKLGLKLITPLYHQNMMQALDYLVAQGYAVMVTSVTGLKREWLGETLDTAKLKELAEWQQKDTVSFETVVVGGPIFKQLVDIRIGYPQLQDEFNGRYLIKEVKLASKS